MVNLTFYGGVNEIGGNKVLLQSQHGSVFFDFGLSYKGENEFFEEFLQPRTNSKFYDLERLGLLPKLNGIYRKDVLCPEGLSNTCTPTPDFWESGLTCYEKACENGTWHPDAVFISHAHADHCGYLPFLGNIPIYCSEKSRKLMKAISQIGNLDGFDKELTVYEYRKIKQAGGSAYFPDSYCIGREKPKERKIEILSSGKKSNIAENMDIIGFDVSHSIPGSMCCLTEADGKQILYTGDIRFHGRDPPDLGALVGLKPDIMITEGTRIDERIRDDEKGVEKELIDLIERTKGLVMIGFAWRDLERYETVKKATQDSGRTPVFDSRVAYLLARLGTDIYKEGASVFVERSDSMLYSPADYTDRKHNLSAMDEDEWSNKKPKKTDRTHLDKGTKANDIQKEPEKYVLHLHYFRFKNLLDIRPPQDSVYVRAQCEPFEPSMELSETRMINWLRHFKINERNNFEPYQIHASGHACGKELQDFIRDVKPKKLIPIHTTKPKLFYNKTGDVIIPETGSAIAL
jgi:ribonuclease J